MSSVPEIADVEWWTNKVTGVRLYFPTCQCRATCWCATRHTGEWRGGARTSAGLTRGGGEGEGGPGAQEARRRVQGDTAGGAGQGEEEEGT